MFTLSCLALSVHHGTVTSVPAIVVTVAPDAGTSSGNGSAGAVLTVATVVLLLLALQHVRRVIAPFAAVIRAVAAAVTALLLVFGALVTMLVGLALR